MERKTMKDENILLAIAFVIGLLFGSTFGFIISADHWRQEIVDKGFAEWQIISSTKETEFKWKEPIK
jgi:hypothetical protein